MTASAPVFSRSADGLPVASIADIVYAMIPTPAGRFYLVEGLRRSAPLEEMTREDFFSHLGNLTDEPDFRSKVQERADHQNELGRLDRHTISCYGVTTPWGRPDSAVEYLQGIVFYETPSHGGFKLSSERNKLVPAKLRHASGWYEEDQEAAIVAYAFPQLFTTLERKVAEKTVVDSWPDAYEAITKRVLAPGESTAKDQRAFEAAHTADWVVVSAITARDNPDLVDVVATLGGRRVFDSAQRGFRVPTSEYATRSRFGFVIDPARHIAG